MKQLALVLGLCIAACGGAQTPSSELPPPNANGEYVRGWPELGSGQARFIMLTLGPDAYQYCRDRSPKFPFDSASTYVQDRAQLVALASCLNHPSMRSRNILLVGRADSSGASDYNMALGQKRADHIRQLLIDAGVAGERIQLMSEGEKEAKGQLADYAPGYDRRVDIIVTGGTHAP